jgi:hypothetical protein
VVPDAEFGGVVEETKAVKAEAPVEPGTAVSKELAGVIGTGAGLENVVINGHESSVMVVLSVVGEASQAVSCEHVSVLVVLKISVAVPDIA